MSYDGDMKKQIKALLADLERQGATIKATSRNGWQVLCPNGGIVTIHATPSDHRALLNLKSELRKRGMTWPL